MNRHPRFRRLLALGLMGLLACGDATAPLPPEAVEIAPPAQYALWWSVTEKCSGLDRDMSDIRWYVVPTAQRVGRDGVYGSYYTASHRIVLVADSINSGFLVRHEMLHALGAIPGHPAKYFQGACAGVVDCQAACIKDGGPLAPVDSNGTIVTPSQLTITVSTDPTVPAKADSVWLAMTVQIANPFPYPVRVRLTPVFSTTSETFGYTFAGCRPGGGYHPPIFDWIPQDMMVLAAGQVRQRVFDITGWSACKLLTPYFNDDTLPPLRVDPIPVAQP